MFTGDVARAVRAEASVPQIREVMQHLASTEEETRGLGDEAQDPQLQVLCETVAEVLEGLQEALTHYCEISRRSWC
jgi:predicted RNase H-like HicB family nuclease